jgi:hypothetical protein
VRASFLRLRDPDHETVEVGIDRQLATESAARLARAGCVI